MRTKEIIKILEKIRVVDQDQFLINLIIEDYNYSQKESLYMSAGFGCVFLGLFLGWFTFGFLPSLRG